MASNLDLSLDDLIKKNKTPASSSSHRGRGRSAAASAPRHFSSHDRSLRRPAPYPAVPSAKYGVYSDQQIAAAAAAAVAGRVGAIETGTKLYISNLDYGVSNEDIKELFTEVGEIKRYSINYDRSGRSKGTAEVVYAKKEDALAAIRRYNNVQLDGKPMKIEFIGTNVEASPVPPVLPAPPSLLPPPLLPFAMNWNPGLLNGMPKSGPGRGMPSGGLRGGSVGGRGRGRGRGSANGKARGKPVSAADLDAELDKYHADAVEDN